MRDGANGNRYLLYGGALLVALVAFATPAAAQGPTVFGQDLTVFGFSPFLQAGIAVLFLLNICILMMSTLENYTQRTTDVILDDPQTTLRTGLGATLVVLAPYVVFVALILLFDAVGLFSLALLIVFAVPLLGVALTAAGVGLVAAGRRASEKEGVVLAVVAAIAAPIGAFPIPFALVGVGIVVLGFGAIVRDLRHGESALEAQGRETYGRQHRYF